MYSTKISQVVAVWQNYANSLELEELGAITKDVIKILAPGLARLPVKNRQEVCHQSVCGWFWELDQRYLEKGYVVKGERGYHRIEKKVAHI